MSENPNKIQRLQLGNFTCFERADLKFSSGINVFIGENGTGKTHLLKVMYALNFDRFVEELIPINDADFGSGITNAMLKKYFGIDKGIVLKRDLNLGTYLIVDYNNFSNRFLLNTIKDPLAEELSQKFEEVSFKEPSKILFLPSDEMLSWQKGFQSLYAKREVSFDRTYYDLAVSLGLGILKNSALEEAQKLAKEIRNAIKAEVFQRDERFYFKFDDLDAELEAPVVAQGINKLGQLYYLILNGSLTKDTILFWDEPETGLNPKYIKVVAQFLQTLANAGVQLFVATHDYLLVHLLSLMSEYPKEYKKTYNVPVPPMRFFALYKGKNGTEIEPGANMTEIQNDAILDEYAAYHELEDELFKKTIKVG